MRFYYVFWELISIIHYLIAEGFHCKRFCHSILMDALTKFHFRSYLSKKSEKPRKPEKVSPFICLNKTWRTLEKSKDLVKTPPPSFCVKKSGKLYFLIFSLVKSGNVITHKFYEQCQFSSRKKHYFVTDSCLQLANLYQLISLFFSGLNVTSV